MPDYSALAKLIETLTEDISNSKKIIALVGAGGKTTTMYGLAKFFKSMKQRVIVTTTTKIMVPDKGQVDMVHIDQDIGQLNMVPGQIVLLAPQIGQEGKIIGYTQAAATSLNAIDYDLLIYEADGAKHKSIKAPNEKEPVLFKNTQIVIGVIGLDVLDLPASEETVHRFDLFREITGICEGAPIEPKHIVKLIQSPIGLFKGVPEHAKCIVLLTKGQSGARYEAAQNIKDLISDWSGTIIVT